MVRRSLLRLLGLGAFNIPGAGGQTPPRPDQQYPAPPIPPVSPGSTNVVRARQVIVSGPGDGIFIYQGQPGPGNTPIAGLSGGTSDPFGNTIPAGLFSFNTGGGGGYTEIFNNLISLFFGSGVAGTIFAGGAGNLTLNSGDVSGDSESAIQLLSATAAGGGNSEINLVTQAVVAQGNVIVNGTLTLVNPILVTGTSATQGLPNGGISGTSGAASAGTAHTHGPGSFSVTNGVHSHGAGSYEVS